MTKELGDVLGTAEAAMEEGLPAFDHVVMAREVTRKAKRRRAIRQSATVLVAGVFLGVAGFGGYLAYDRLSDKVGPVIFPSPTDGSQPSPTAGWPEVADRTVTTGPGLPVAVALTDEAYATADTGWVLAIFDSTQRLLNKDPVEGERVLYLISPIGERYEVANLTRYGSLHLAAWDTDRQVALIVDGRYIAMTLDLATGEVTHKWQFCGEGGSLTAKDLPGEEWLLRGFCSGEPLDGVYSDDFTFVTGEGIVKGGEGITVTDIGDVQVRYEFEMAPAQSFRAYHPDGTETAMEPVGDYMACYPAGPSKLGGLVVTCWDDNGDVTVWNLDFDGGPATQIASTEILFDLAAQSMVPLPLEGAVFTGYCSTETLEAVETSHPAVAVIGGESDIFGILIMVDGRYHLASGCYGGVGDTLLLTGDGVLWTWTQNAGNPNGDIVILVPVPDMSDNGEWVGAAEGGAIIHP